MKLRVLFVCEGNTCRSPMARILAEHLLGDRFMFNSAGVHVTEHSINSNAARVLREIYGQGASGHKPKKVSPDLLAQSDKVITFSPALASELRSMGASPVIWEVPDPWQKPYSAYKATAALLMEHLNKWNDA